MTAGVLARGGLRTCRCGARYDARSLAALRPVQTLEAAEISRMALDWPSDVVVDVRACSACDAPIARLLSSGPSRTGRADPAR